MTFKYFLYLFDRALGLPDISEVSDLLGHVLGLGTERGLAVPVVGGLGLTLFTAVGLFPLGRVGLSLTVVEGLARASRAASSGGCWVVTGLIPVAGTAAGLARPALADTVAGVGLSRVSGGLTGLARAAGRLTGLARAAGRLAGLARAAGRLAGLARAMEWLEGAGLTTRGLDVCAGVRERDAVSSSCFKPDVEAPVCWLAAISSNPGWGITFIF